MILFTAFILLMVAILFWGFICMGEEPLDEHIFEEELHKEEKNEKN